MIKTTPLNNIDFTHQCYMNKLQFFCDIFYSVIVFPWTFVCLREVVKSSGLSGVTEGGESNPCLDCRTGLDTALQCCAVQSHTLHCTIIVSYTALLQAHTLHQYSLIHCTSIVSYTALLQSHTLHYNSAVQSYKLQCSAVK